MTTFPTYLTTRIYQVDNNTVMPQLKLGHCGQSTGGPSFMEGLCTSHWTGDGCLLTTTVLQPTDQSICLGYESLKAAH